MYLPTHFKHEDRAHLLEVMQTWNFALLCSNVDGAPFATHLPVLASERDGAVVIEGHMAAANPHWKALRDDPRALIVFSGPHTYVSPTGYKSVQRVPTWNYIAVHATGAITLIEDSAAKHALLEHLAGHHEPDFMPRFETFEAGYRSSMLNAIVGFEMRVDQLEGKFKLGQNRLADNKPESQAQLEAGGENEKALAQWMKKLGYA